MLFIGRITCRWPTDVMTARRAHQQATAVLVQHDHYRRHDKYRIGDIRRRELSACDMPHASTPSI